MMIVTPDELLLQRVRVIGEFQLYGEADDGGILDGEAWMSNVLTDAKTGGLIEDFKVLLVTTGFMGLQLVQFYVDVLQHTFDHEQAKELGTNLLEEYILHDQVDVRWVSFDVSEA